MLWSGAVQPVRHAVVSVVRYGAVQCGEVWRGVAWRGLACGGVAQRGVVWRSLADQMCPNFWLGGIDCVPFFFSTSHQCIPKKTNNVCTMYPVHWDHIAH